MNDESDSRMVRLPVREMRDEPAPQRAAQEGDLPPLPHWCEAGSPMAQQMQSYARLALAAAGGGVPQGDEYVGGLEYRGNSVAYIYQKLTAYRYATDEAWQAMRDAGRGPDGKTKLADAIRNALASSPQPEVAMTQQERDILQGMREIKEGKGSEAAPAVAQVPHHYRKKPVVIEAHQWDGTESGIQRIKAHFPALQTLAKTGHLRRDEVTHWRIGTLEGGHEVSKGDWIIKGIKGEFYPCKPDIFDATYEAAPEAPAQAAPSAGEVERGNAEYLCKQIDAIRKDVRVVLKQYNDPYAAIDLMAHRIKDAVFDAALSHKEQP